MWLVQASEIRAEVIDTIGQARLIIHYYLFPHSQPEQRVTWVSRGGKCPQRDRACVCIWSTHELANQRECTPPQLPTAICHLIKALRLGSLSFVGEIQLQLPSLSQKQPKWSHKPCPLMSSVTLRSTSLTSPLLFWACKQTAHSECQKFTCG